MKVIDLYLKYSRGEKIPKKVKYEDIIYTYDEEANDYVNDDYPNGLMDIMDRLDFLNIEIEIIEEDKEIEEIDMIRNNIDNYYIIKDGKQYQLSRHDTVIINKINELVREVKKIRNK